MEQFYKQFLSLQITSLPDLRLQPQPIQKNSLEILSNIIQDIYKLDSLMNDTVFEYFKEVLNCKRDFNCYFQLSKSWRRWLTTPPKATTHSNKNSK